MKSRVAACSALLVCFAALGLFVDAAGAADPGSVQSNEPAVNQYIEQVPSAAGSRGVIQSRGHRRAVPNKIVQQIQAKAGTDAGLLTDADAAAEYGAPVANRSSAIGQTATADVSSGMTTLLVLLGLLVAGSLVSAAVVSRRRTR